MTEVKAISEDGLLRIKAIVLKDTPFVKQEAYMKLEESYREAIKVLQWYAHESVDENKLKDFWKPFHLDQGQKARDFLGVE